MRGASEFVNKVGICKRCDEPFEKTSKRNFLCPDCKKESRRLGRIKARKTMRRLKRRGFL